MNIKDWGQVPNTENLPGIPARVTAVHKERYEIVCEHGITHARLKTKEYFVDTQDFPTAGDFVMIHYIDNGDSQIIATLPRRTLFSRREPGPIPRDQAVAANFDYVFIMQSLNQDFNPKRLERYLTLGWQSGATPVILLTKADLVEDYWDYLMQVERVAAGVNVHVVSAHTGYGLPRLNAYLQPGKTVVFLGSSGVGKSSLVNAVTGQNLAVVSDVRGTTTDPVKKAMELLPMGPVMIIDTPGFDDEGTLGMQRVQKAKQILNRADVAVLVVDAAEGMKTCDEELFEILENEGVNEENIENVIEKSLRIKKFAVAFFKLFTFNIFICGFGIRKCICHPECQISGCGKMMIL